MSLELNDFSAGYSKFPFLTTQWALRNVNVSFDAGLSFLIAPNGAGKSTLLRGIAYRDVISQGTVTVNGQCVSPANVTEYVGYCPQEFRLPKAIEVLDYLAYLGSMTGAKPATSNVAARAALQQVNLHSLSRAQMGSLSGGQKRRLGIAQAIMFERPVVLLDEPTVGLDEESREAVRQVVSDIANTATVIFATHIRDDHASMQGRVIDFEALKGQV